MRTSEAFHLPTAPIEDIRAVAETDGPFLSAYLITEGAVENARQLLLQRWSVMRGDLQEEGVPPATLDRVDEVVDAAHKHGRSLGLVADTHTVRLVDHFDEPVARDRACWHVAPDVVPLIKWRQERVPHVLVFADRGGADVIGVPSSGHEFESDLNERPERKVAPGGWSQPRFQQRAEEDWAKTAKNVAAMVETAYDNVAARLVVLGGDVRAVQLIRDAVRADVRENTVRMELGRAVDGSDEARDEEVRRLVATTAASETVACLERFKEEIGQRDLAVGGFTATAEAVGKGAVEILLVGEGADHQGTDMIVRNALRTGAQVRVIPRGGPVPDGIGGLLRWRDAQ